VAEVRIESGTISVLNFTGQPSGLVNCILDYRGSESTIGFVILIENYFVV